MKYGEKSFEKKVFEKLVGIKKALIFAPPKQTSEGLTGESS